MKAQSCYKRNQVITRHKQSLTETKSHNDKIRSQHHKVNKTQPKRRRNDSNGVLRQRDKFPTTTDKIQRTRRKSPQQTTTTRMKTLPNKTVTRIKLRDQLGEETQSVHKWSTSQDGETRNEKETRTIFVLSQRTPAKEFEKKEPMRNVQWKMTQRKMTHNDDTKAKEFLERRRNQ